MLQSPLAKLHAERGAKFVEYAGWSMPLHFGDILGEHNQTRTAASIFDVSHMARFKFAGRGARRLLERLVTRRVSDMQVGQCRYGMVCNERGGVMDDVIVYRFDDHWLMVANAANRAKLLDHIAASTGELNVKFEDITEKTAMVALQGPGAMDLIANFSKEIPTLKRYRFTVKNLMILKLIVSRTGYTGEDGVEIILPANMVGMALKLLMKDQGEDGMQPAGLAARDTLRMEAGMPLYGHELDEDTDPLSAGLAFAVSLDKDEDENGEACIGLDALKKIAADGPAKQLVGLKVDGKRAPRQHMKVTADGIEVGEVTSGCVSPTLGHPIAMAYVPAAHAVVGTKLAVDFGRASADAEVVALPFYKPAKK